MKRRAREVGLRVREMRMTPFLTGPYSERCRRHEAWSWARQTISAAGLQKGDNPCWNARAGTWKRVVRVAMWAPFMMNACGVKKEQRGLSSKGTCLQLKRAEAVRRERMRR